jgi:hypothetical protein
MSNRALIIIAVIVTGLVIVTGTIWYLRSQDAGVAVYNPFQVNQQVEEEPVYAPPSDYSSPSESTIDLPAINPPEMEPNILLEAEQ